MQRMELQTENQSIKHFFGVNGRIVFESSIPGHRADAAYSMTPTTLTFRAFRPRETPLKGRFPPTHRTSHAIIKFP